MGYLILFISLSFYFGAHGVGYYFLVSNFSFFHDKLNYLRISFFILSFGFILSFIISHLWKNIFTKFLYIFFGIWVGFLINLIFFALIFWGILFLFGILGKDFDSNKLALLTLLFALLYAVYGISNVFCLRIKNIDIEIKNLPSYWENKKIVHLSDLHLGKVLGPKFLDKVAQKVNRENPELIVITGDLFDSSDGPLSVFESGLNNLKAPKGTYYVTGNHEIYLGIDDVEKNIIKTNINYLNDRVVNLEGLQLIGVNYPQIGEKKDFDKILRTGNGYNQNEPSILLFHSPTSVLSDGKNNHSTAYFFPDTDFTGLKDLGIDLQLSGHTHGGQVFPFNILTRLIFRTYDYGLKTDGDFSIYTTSGAGVWGPTMRTGSKSEIVVITLKNQKPEAE